MTPWVSRLLLANILMYALCAASPSLYAHLLLVPGAILVRPWTPLTYMFLHAGFLHLFFNMVGLYFFGPRLELRLGSRPFLRLYLLSGLGGALLSLFTPTALIVGASGAVFGVFLGFARYWPRSTILIWGVLPVQARWLVAFLTAVALLGAFGRGGSGVAHFAHLGGFLTGLLYLKHLERRERSRREPPTPRRAELRQRQERWATIRRDEMHPVNQAELDRVLAKLQDAGPGQLSREELAFLDRFSHP